METLLFLFLSLETFDPNSNVLSLTAAPMMVIPPEKRNIIKKIRMPFRAGDISSFLVAIELTGTMDLPCPCSP